LWQDNAEKASAQCFMSTSIKFKPVEVSMSLINVDTRERLCLQLVIVFTELTWLLNTYNPDEDRNYYVSLNGVDTSWFGLIA
jgi:hypothetical protein